jgi:hypothetical protein
MQYPKIREAQAIDNTTLVIEFTNHEVKILLTHNYTHPPERPKPPDSQIVPAHSLKSDRPSLKSLNPSLTRIHASLKSGDRSPKNKDHSLKSLTHLLKSLVHSLNNIYSSLMSSSIKKDRILEKKSVF